MHDKRTRLPLLSLVALLGLAAFAVAAEEDSHRWFSVAIEVRGLPAGSQAVPVTIPVDFTAMLGQLNVRGVIDEHSIRLFHVAPSGEAEVPVQYVAEQQPRVKQQKPKTGPKAQASYIAEFAAGEQPADLKQRGTLTWFAQSEGEVARYRMKFGIPNRGALIQVPYPPENLVAIGEDGRISPLRHFPTMQIRPQWPLDGRVQVFDRGQLFTALYTGPTLAEADAAPRIRRPFFYPVNGPDGVSLTEFGKAHDPTGSHAHHYSLWIAHNSVAGQEFWSERGGVIAHERFDELLDGPVFCRLVQSLRWRAKGADLLRERRSVTIFESRQGRLMDFDIELNTAGKEPVELGKTTFGFLSVRVAQSMTPFDGGGEIRNSSGELNELGVHLRRAQWLDQSGPAVAGSKDSASSLQPPVWSGIAMFDHPANPHHPTVWHCRNDGWACASFNGEDAYTIEPGRPLALRYRLFIHRGSAKEAEVAKRYAEFAAKPEVQIGTLKEEQE